jgi:hypothetical protein
MARKIAFIQGLPKSNRIRRKNDVGKLKDKKGFVSDLQFNNRHRNNAPGLFVGNREARPGG